MVAREKLREGARLGVVFLRGKHGVAQAAMLPFRSGLRLDNERPWRLGYSLQHRGEIPYPEPATPRAFLPPGGALPHQQSRVTEEEKPGA